MAIQSATDKENIPEHKYDTLSLEAAYLAHGQAQRVEESLKELQQFKSFPVKLYTAQDKIGLMALIELCDVELDISKWFFLSPVSGGLIIQFEQCDIQLITKESPLGKCLYGKQVNDELKLKIASNHKYYEIVAVF